MQMLQPLQYEHAVTSLNMDGINVHVKTQILLLFSQQLATV